MNTGKSELNSGTGIPKHINVLSIIIFLNAGIAALIGAIALGSLLFSDLNSGVYAYSGSNGISSMLTHFGITILLTIISISFLILLGINLRRLKPWARNLTIAYCLLAVIFTIINAFLGDSNLSIFLLVQIYALWVLFNPEVKDAFGVKAIS